MCAQGNLKGFDQKTNIILDECHERVFSPDNPVEQVPLGLYVVRGDNMCAQRTTAPRPEPASCRLTSLGAVWAALTSRTPALRRVPFGRSAIIGEIDEAADAELDLSAIRAEPLAAVVH